VKVSRFIVLFRIIWLIVEKL